MRRATTILLLFIITGFTAMIHSQSLHTRSNRALRFYDIGKRDYEMLYYDRAEQNLNTAVKEDPAFYEAYLILGQLYTDQGEWEKAVESYTRAVTLDSLGFVPALFSLGKAELKTGRYLKARVHLDAYLAQAGTSSKLREETGKMLKNCLFALSFPVSVLHSDPESVGDSVNTDLDEYWPSLTGDGQELIFTREVRRASAYGRDRQEDFYISRWNRDGYWGTARNAGAPLNTAGNEGAQSIASDGRSMYFTACDRPDGHGRCDIYFSTFDGQRWSPGKNIGSPVNTSAWESQPSISPDGKMLFFVSNRPGGVGGMDIWYSVMDRSGSWGKPVNPGKEINTTGNEFSPFIYFNGRTLYFSSDGRESFGGQDIYYTNMNPDTTWSEPVNLGPAVNTPADETGLVIESSGKLAFFSSIHDKAHGKDIFFLKLPEEIQPEPVSYLKGTVIDKADGKALKAKYELTNLTNRTQVISSITDNNGNFFICLPSGYSYGLNVTSDGYMIYSENFDFESGYTSAEPYYKNIGLNRVRKGEFMRMYNVFYNTASWELLESSLPELQSLVDFLRINSTVVVEIGGHTDSDGSDEYNQVLSEKRAASVRDYLIKHGINGDRLFFHGYGESLPVADNLTPAGKKLNRRTEITILSEGTSK